MSFVQNYSVSQSQSDWTNLTFTDTSTGTDGNIASRVIFIQKSNGAYLSTVATDYIPWSYGEDSIDVNGLITKDYSLLITVQWLDVDGVVLYTLTKLYLFTAYSVNGEYGIIQALTAKPNIQQDRLYWLNLGRLQANISNAELATYYAQQVKSQAAINRAAYLLSNQLTNF